MNTARRSISLNPDSDSKKPAPSGQYRMVQPRSRPDSLMPAPLPARRQRAHNNAQYLDTKPIVVPLKSLPPAKSADVKSAPTKSAPVQSAKPKVVSLDLDDAFDFEGEEPADAPDSLVQMMDGLEGTKVKEEAAWPKEMPSVPRPPSVPKMEAINPTPNPLHTPVSRLTPAARPVNEHEVIGEFAKFGPPPASIWQSVGYMFHVRTRKEQLKQELGLYRQRRASDVDLYEKALRHIDEDAMRRGYTMLAGGGLLGILVIVMICVLL